jgi:hypothetical protein
MTKLVEDVTDAVRNASPYWGDHLHLSDDEARAAIRVVLQTVEEHFSDSWIADEVRLLAHANNIKLYEAE